MRRESKKRTGDSRRRAARADAKPLRVVAPGGDARRGGRAVLVTGGAGFVGTNVARSYLAEGRPVILYDSLARPGVERNLQLLREEFGDLVRAEIADVRDAERVRAAVDQAAAVYHFAAQVAVTTSLEDPVEDFEVNARGTLNVLEAVRRSAHRPPVLFTSTNKVYGGLEDVGLTLDGGRYAPENARLRARGVSEERPLDFHSPYGCSKGTADQYVRDYARSFGLRTVVFRMSCIYGPYQYGTEDQGWVAHFMLRGLEGQPISIYGDGHQVRDILFVEDLVAAMRLAVGRADALAGEAFNMGGGPAQAVCLNDVLALVGEAIGAPVATSRGPWRVGDQRYYVSNTAKFRAATGWRPRVGVAEGLARLREWIVGQRPYVERLAAARGSR